MVCGRTRRPLLSKLLNSPFSSQRRSKGHSQFPNERTREATSIPALAAPAPATDNVAIPLPLNESVNALTSSTLS
jgi:hypothetical protein